MGNSRPRARDIGLTPGTISPGALNSITDVAGVRVGHETVIRGNDVRTGVTAILPHDGNIYQEKVPAAIFVSNGHGKLMGLSQVNELGEIETPILLTNTLSVGRVADVLVDYMLSLPGNEEVTSINPIVGETNDGFLNDIRGKHIGKDEALGALLNAQAGAVSEGSIGAGTGTVALGFKGGIGTSSRLLPKNLGGYAVGVLVQTNFDGILTINGAPVGKELGRYFMKEQLEMERSNVRYASGTRDCNSVVVVITTDACLDHRNLSRLAARASLGLARTGSISGNRSGDYFIAFSTAQEARIRNAPIRQHQVEYLRNDAMSPLFLAVIEATEEAVYNSLFRATTVKGRNNHIAESLPIKETQQILHKHNML
jgi:D-aminopeptidase